MPCHYPGTNGCHWHTVSVWIMASSSGSRISDEKNWCTGSTRHTRPAVQDALATHGLQTAEGVFWHPPKFFMRSSSNPTCPPSSQKTDQVKKLEKVRSTILFHMIARSIKFTQRSSLFARFIPWPPMQDLCASDHNLHIEHIYTLVAFTGPIKKYRSNPHRNVCASGVRIFLKTRIYRSSDSPPSVTPALPTCSQR